MRNKPKNLHLMEILHPRMPFNSQQEKIFTDAKKGFDGECAADNQMDAFLDNCIIINDLCLQANRFCQIDKLIIAPSNIYMLEIKNYGGTFIYDNKQFFNRKMEERDNPFLQLERTEQQLRMFTKTFDLPLYSRILTMNAAFQLHGSTVEMPLIPYGQLESFVRFVANDRRSLTSSHYELARYLRESHQTQNRYEQLMPFDFPELKQGVFCSKCEAEMSLVSRRSFLCEACGSLITKRQVVQKSLEELRILGISQRAGGRLIREWTGNQMNLRGIERSLQFLNKNDHSNLL